MKQMYICPLKRKMSILNCMGRLQKKNEKTKQKNTIICRFETCRLKILFNNSGVYLSIQMKF